MKTLNKKNLKKINKMINHYHVYSFIHAKHKNDTDKVKKAWASYNWYKGRVVAIDLYKEFGISVIAEDYIAEIDENYAKSSLEFSLNRWLEATEEAKAKAKAVA